MSDGHTPSLDEVRDRYIQPQSQREAMDPDAHYIVGEEFDRAIAKVRADAKVEALREAADLLDEESPFHNISDTEAHWAIGGKWAARFRSRADNLEAS